MAAPCPVCRKMVNDDVPERPFCGPRCQLVDLGRWIDGTYRIPDEEPAPTDASPEPSGRENLPGAAQDTRDTGFDPGANE